MHITSLLFQMQLPAASTTFQSPLSCPLDAAFSPGLHTALVPDSSTLPGPLLSAGSYGRTDPAPLYPQQWSFPSPVGSVGPVGLLGTARMMPYAPPHQPENLPTW